jgi:hypothetical protein
MDKTRRQMIEYFADIYIALERIRDSMDIGLNEVLNAMTERLEEDDAEKDNNG